MGMGGLSATGASDEEKKADVDEEPKEYMEESAIHLTASMKGLIG
jgi:hypothetical protein